MSKISAMRGILVTSTVTACAAALTLPFLATTGVASPGEPEEPSAAGLAGSTHSLPLAPLGETGHLTGRVSLGVKAQQVKPFSLVGIVWDSPAAQLRGRAQVRTRGLGSRTWSRWQDVQPQDHDRPDLDTAEARSGRRGATAPLWVGASDAVEARVKPDSALHKALPHGLRLELVDPGADPVPKPGRRRGPGPNDDEHASSAANAQLAPVGATEIPAGGKPVSPTEVAALTATATGDPGPGSGHEGEHASNNGRPAPPAPVVAPPVALPSPPEPPAGPPAPAGTVGTGEGGDSADDSDPLDNDGYSGYAGPRPRIVTRAGWGADESIRESGFVYTKSVKAAFVHHTASGNTYSCAQSASVIRGIYRYHVVSSGWRDIGYNFLVDKCGTIYEGRAGGVAKPVRGAHTLGFNTNSMGIAVLGTFGKTAPSSAAVDAVARITAWKLGLYGANPKGTATLVSAGGNLFKKGSKVKLKAVSGHRDGYNTECPGDKLYARLGTIRSTAARLQGR